MKVRLEPTDDGGAFILIPAEVLEQLGWEPDREVIIDIPLTGPNLIVYRNTPTPTMGWGDKREKSNGR